MNKEEQWLLEEKYNGIKSPAFTADCARLATGEPLAYVIGHSPFLGCTIHLDEHPLIPRPETEYWTEKAITEIQNLMNVHMNVHAPVPVLDLCAGSGAIGVAVAKHVPEVRVDLVEIDPYLLPTITKNLHANTIIYDSEKYRVIESDLFSNITDRYLFILSNPPYIDPELDRTQDSVKNYEPHGALYGGADGMELIKRIITEAPKHLLPNGQLWLEHEPEQTSQIHALANPLFASVTTHKDQYGVERYSVLVLQ